MKYLKHILITIALVPFITASYFVFTQSGAKAAENQFYLKGGTGLNTINPFQIRDDDYKGKIKVSHAFPLIELGAGYKLADGMRIEGVFDYYFLFYSKERASDLIGNKYAIESKTKAHAFFLNGYKDITNIGNFTPFVGGGIGISTLQEQASGYAVSILDDMHYPLDKVKSKRVNRFAYKLTFGIDYAMSRDYHSELSYNYMNLGYNKPKKLDGIDNMQHRRYGVHGIILGLRKNI